MKILALETSGFGAAVALLEDGTLLVEEQLGSEERSARGLAPLIQTVLSQLDWQPGDVELIGVTLGPGSFTGLRVGVTTAKMLAFAIGCKLVGVNTLRALAEPLPVEFERGWSILDAQRGELFAQAWRRQAGVVEPMGDVEVLSELALIGKLQSGDAIVGPVLARVAEQIPAGAHVVAESFWQPTAASVGRLAHKAFLSGQVDDAISLVPQYFRRTAAEEQWERLGRK
jgi:tRNA threonylcarbamoyladenosine biosynthesis protein TsaB